MRITFGIRCEDFGGIGLGLKHTGWSCEWEVLDMTLKLGELHGVGWIIYDCYSGGLQANTTESILGLKSAC